MAGQRFIDLHIHINPFHKLHEQAYATLARHQSDFEALQEYTRSAEALVERMDRENVQKAALINYVAPIVMGYKPDVNEWVHKYTADHRDRLIPYGGLDPGLLRDARDAQAEVDRLLSKLELAGIKVHPPHTLVWPNDYAAGGGALAKLYEACEATGVPVLFHTGTSIFPGARSKYGDPMALDDVAIDFPRLKIVMAHGGRPLWMETAFFLLRRHKNVWLDISSIPPKALLSYFPRLEEVSDRVVFGSDWPGPHVPSMRANADAVDALPLPEEALKGILVDNAQRLLGRS